MKVMQLAKPQPINKKPLSQVDKEALAPGPDEVRVGVRMCGVCHTDLHTVEGDLDLPKLPIVPGHQVVGLVEAVGENVSRHMVGDRVGIGWLNWTCGECHYCHSGQENLCLDARFTGLHADGGYAEQMVIDKRFAFPLPEAFADEEAAPLLCAGIIGFRSLRLSGIAPGQRLGLYGFGASAHLAIQVATYWNCEVYVYTRSEAHRDHARELGAVWAGSAKDETPELLDAAVTFAPAGWIVPLALSHLRPGGTLAINAIHMSPIPELDYQKLYHERMVRSVANFTRQDADEFLRLAAEIPVETAVTRYALANANAALQDLKASQIRGAVVLDVAT